VGHRGEPLQGGTLDVDEPSTLPADLGGCGNLVGSYDDTASLIVFYLRELDLLMRSTFSATCSRTLHTSLALLLVLGPAGAACAQDGGWRSFVSVSPVFEEADLDGGGDFNLGGVIARAGTSVGFGDGNRAGITVNYDYFDYSFDDPTTFGGVAPWSIVQRYGVSAPLSFALRDGWTVGVAPSVDWFRENGAKTSESLVWGATISAVKRFADGNVLGLGVGAFDGLEETALFAFPVVDWRFSPHWRLINPLAAGPTGPAGLELDYLFDGGWTLGAGVAWRKARYRLREEGPAPNGVGEVSGAPIYLRLSRDFERVYTLNFYGGVVAGGELRVEDAGGNLLRTDDFDLSPILGFNITARF
jgi:hypothetical protein